MTERTKRIQSPSSILAYKHGDGFKWGCPRKYYLRYIKRLRPKPKPSLMVGGLIHKTIENVTKAYREEMLDWEYGKLRKLALTTLQHEWDRKKEELATVCKNQFHYAQLFKDSKMMVINWVHQFIKDVLSREDPPVTETRIVSERLGMQGVIDAIYNIQGEAEILDYKTSSFDQITPDVRLQLAVYALLYKEECGRLPDRVSVHFLKFPASDKNPRRFKPTEKLIDYAAREVNRIHELTQSDKESDYPCLCGGWCEEEFQC
jgi:CRISPR/Cas system-associated exonuclease Cas4 (RecB family)